MNTALTPEDIRQCEALLLERRAALRAALLERVRPGEGGCFKAAAVEVHDLKDSAFEHLLANIANTELAHGREELAAIQAALRRVGEGEYGVCSECGREVGRARLLVQPSAERCVACQERIERESAPPGVFTA